MASLHFATRWPIDMTEAMNRMRNFDCGRRLDHGCHKHNRTSALGKPLASSNGREEGAKRPFTVYRIDTSFGLLSKNPTALIPPTRGNIGRHKREQHLVAVGRIDGQENPAAIGHVPFQFLRRAGVLLPDQVMIAPYLSRRSFSNDQRTKDGLRDRGGVSSLMTPSSCQIEKSSAVYLSSIE